MLWGHLSRCPVTTARQHPRLGPCRDWAAPLASGSRQAAWRQPEGTRHRGHDGAGAAAGLEPCRAPRRDTRGAAVSSSGACAEGNVREGRRAAGLLGLVPANASYASSPGTAAVTLSGRSRFACLPSDGSGVLQL